MVRHMAADKNRKNDYTVDEVADLANRTAAMIRNYCNDTNDPIEHKKYGRMYIITHKGMKQAVQRAATARRGPTGPRKQKVHTSIMAI